MSKELLNKYINISKKGDPHSEDKMLKEIGIETGKDWDVFMDGVWDFVGSLNNQEILRIIERLAKKKRITPWRNFDTIQVLLDMHEETNPDKHPDERILDFLCSIIVSRENNFDWHSFIVRYGKYKNEKGHYWHGHKDLADKLESTNKLRNKLQEKVDKKRQQEKQS
ncbi:hypothetical protein ACFL2V_09435 [Pseudomonadota bacterium]